VAIGVVVSQVYGHLLPMNRKHDIAT